MALLIEIPFWIEESIYKSQQEVVERFSMERKKATGRYPSPEEFQTAKLEFPSAGGIFKTPTYSQDSNHEGFVLFWPRRLSPNSHVLYASKDKRWLGGD